MYDLALIVLLFYVVLPLIYLTISNTVRRRKRKKYYRQLRVGKVINQLPIGIMSCDVSRTSSVIKYIPKGQESLNE